MQLWTWAYKHHASEIAEAKEYLEGHKEKIKAWLENGGKEYLKEQWLKHKDEIKAWWESDKDFETKVRFEHRLLGFYTPAPVGSNSLTPMGNLPACFKVAGLFAQWNFMFCSIVSRFSVEIEIRFRNRLGCRQKSGGSMRRKSLRRSRRSWKSEKSTMKKLKPLRVACPQECTFPAG